MADKLTQLRKHLVAATEQHMVQSAPYLALPNGMRSGLRNDQRCDWVWDAVLQMVSILVSTISREMGSSMYGVFDAWSARDIEAPSQLIPSAADSQLIGRRFPKTPEGSTRSQRNRRIPRECRSHFLKSYKTLSRLNEATLPETESRPQAVKWRNLAPAILDCVNHGEIARDLPLEHAQCGVKTADKVSKITPK
ncbi:hypothetical protein CAPTEDRAFT_191337 [Capitella teleta]|uniref:Uncharacterized protein n=1 Tax=Capitella teleta TaxID=283909 RepID=R7U7H2_CAPTE|nr:hypothetical protein CAPTEDRAFT_191337 [Capitella teleta]|eukprot:ELU01909.1 hypothetical protein CAPTEDRAFT_191337 [Capitella teleta]